jgi:hypothetical protein
MHQPIQGEPQGGQDPVGIPVQVEPGTAVLVTVPGARAAAIPRDLHHPQEARGAPLEVHRKRVWYGG